MLIFVMPRACFVSISISNRIEVRSLWDLPWGCCGIPGAMMWDSCGTMLEFPVVLLVITVILLWHDCGIPVIAGWIACCGVALVLL